MKLRLAEAARIYADRRRWEVFPLAARSKIPLVAKDHGGNGCLDATSDPGIVAAWWEAQPDANIGLHCGAGSGVFVLDVDASAPKGGGLTGPDAVAALEATHGALPDTLTSSTGGGGEHRFFRMPTGRTVRNRARVKVDGQPSGLDVRADGGYVVLPPSVHPSGRRYEWKGSVREVKDAPEWLLDVIDPPRAANTAPPVVVPESDASTRYGTRALQSACDEIQAAATGGASRHEALFRASAAIGELVGGGVIDEAMAVAALIAAGEAAGKSHREVGRTVADGIAKGKQSPRRPEPRERPAGNRAPWEDGPPGWMLETAPPDELPHVVDASHEGDPGPASPEPAYNLTDLGNARRLVSMVGQDYRWCGAMPGSGWMCWDGARWIGDDTRAITRAAMGVADAWRKTAWLVEGDDEAAEARRAAILRHADRTENAGRIAAMVDLAGADPRIIARQVDFDADPWLFATPRETLDLRNVRAYPPRREDMLTRRGAVAVDGAAACPTWLAFLHTVMDGDVDLVSFLQRVAGYCLTGDTSEQCLFVAHGSGANGKGTFLEVLRYILGDYARNTPIETFVGRRQGAIPNDLAALAGVRLVSCSEPDEGGALNEGLVKLVTGEDTITARFLNQEFFDYRPRFKLWMLTNHRPVIRGADNGIWRRLRLIPFTVTIPPERRDRGLKQKLIAEAPGILTWMLDGCAEWQNGGLQPPAAVLDATQAYRDEMDVLGGFIAERLVISDPNDRCDNADLYRAFKAWCEDTGDFVRNQRWLSRQMLDRGFKQDGRRDLGRRWIGVRLGDGARVAAEPRGWSRRGTAEA